MRLILTIFLFQGIMVWGAPICDSSYTETTYFSNGKIRSIIDFGIYKNAIKMNGRYIKYSEEGVLLVEGNYAVLFDSVNCVDCFYSLHDSIFQKYDKSEFNETRIGVWNYYYNNGKLKESGEYSVNIHEVYSVCLVSSETEKLFEGPCPRGKIGEYLKTGPWKYYDENGFLIKTIVFYEDRIIEERYAK